MKTTHAYRGYVFVIGYTANDPAYVVEFPDIPGIVTSGVTLTDAFANACEALDLHLESLQKLGRPLPRARHRVVVKSA
jgi:predicted RNase H-like HicB family nuclease